MLCLITGAIVAGANVVHSIISVEASKSCNKLIAQAHLQKLKIFVTTVHNNGHQNQMLPWDLFINREHKSPLHYKLENTIWFFFYKFLSNKNQYFQCFLANLILRSIFCTNLSGPKLFLFFTVYFNLWGCIKLCVW